MSKYMSSLSKDDCVKYSKKLRDLGFEDRDDPFILLEQKKVLDDWVDDVSKWPLLEFPAMFSYLVSTPGPFTMESIQAYRSLEAYNYYVSGWVQTTYIKHGKKGKCILAAKVTRSQAVTDKPHQAWVGIKTVRDQAVVETAHCTCMAGLGEVCSHVAAIMFKVKRAGEMGFSNPASTDLPCVWNQNFTKKVEAVPLGQIHFSKPSRHEDPSDQSPAEPEPSPDDPSELLAELRKAVPGAAIFTVVSPKKNIRNPRLPPNLRSLYKEANVNLSEIELDSLIQTTFRSLSVTHIQCVNLEKQTRKQSSCKEWHTYRHGRITASRIHDVISSKSDKISASAIKSICYGSNFSTPATTWGLETEKTALSQYVKQAETAHTGLTFRACGLIVDESEAFLAASPDGLIECHCCGKGVVEVKCPYTYKEKHPCEISMKDFCLKEHTSKECDGALKCSHRYFSQVQAQMGICRVDYCDFVCYTPKGIHIERILYDHQFFQRMVEKARKVFVCSILPELLTFRSKLNSQGAK